MDGAGRNDPRRSGRSGVRLEQAARVTRRAGPGWAAGVSLLLALLPAAGLAGTTGKLTGRVLDAKKQPLPGVNVAVPLGRVGAITDDKGRFVIVNIPSGTYEVKINLLGYRPIAIQNVSVSADLTTELDDVAMVEAPVGMEEVVVSARRPVVDLNLTSNLATLHRKEIQQLPVQELQDVVNLKAGVVDGHFRGGRIGEVQYQVDGVTINNPFDNSASLKLDRSLLEEVQVISGTFDAEYGQAMSGVVNAVLRSGTEKYRADGEVFAGGFAFPRTDGRGVTDSFHPDGIQNYQFNVSGPLGLPHTTFLANARRYLFDDFVQAERRFRPWQALTPQDKVQSPDGDGAKFALGYNREWSGVVKLTNRSIPHVELDYSAVGNVIETRATNNQYRLNPDGLTRQHKRSIAHGLDLTHTLSKTTFYTLSLRQNYFDYRDMAYDDSRDPRYELAGPVLPDHPYEADAYVEGVDPTRVWRRTNAVVFKNSLVSQLSHDQQIKLGSEFEWPHVEFGVPESLRFVAPTNALQRRPGYIPPWRPYAAAAFAQDELEWNDLRLRAGLRLEYFNPRAGIPSDLANPANAIAGVPQSHLVATTRKWSVAPRIGVSYPVTRKSALFFAYGHFYQMPELGQIFDNADYSVLAGLQAGGISYGILGNPDIKPEKTVQYQFGYKQSISDDFGIDLTLFYKDIRDLLGVEFVTTYNGAQYARLANADFGNVIGFTVAVTRRSGPLLSTALDYTWQLAQGNSSDPHETATRAEGGLDARPRLIPFDWDQRHTLNVTVTAARGDAFNVSTIVHVSSGRPFTPSTATVLGTTLESNGERKPNTLVVDLRGERRLGPAGVQLRGFARVFNVFDTRFNNGFVFESSGSPNYSRFPSADYVSLADPTRFYAPRRVEVGVSLRGEE